ncbi:MAG TPA: 50S ribosomal protein L25 [Bryobacteraceae bacterium]|jgi:large subunit ribosomal protein L25|nr:50S ribosomal protein L25 [Bryobacteraceae bacterium]
MKTDITIAAERRDSRGKNEARRLRARGLAPAVVYGAGKEPIAVSVNPVEVSRILRSSTGHNTIFNIHVKGVETTPAMIVEWQHDPIKSRLLHIDLKRIDLTKRLTVKVPVHVTGDPAGVKIQGGLLELIVREVEIECLPDEIPEAFTVDVSPLMIGQSIRASELQMPGSAKLVSAPEAVIAHVIALRTSETAAEAAAVEGAAPAAAEPEVIKKGKKEEEGAAEEKEKKKK